MCSIEEKLEMENKLPKFYRRYVDDVCAVMQGLSAAEAFRDSLNNSHPSVNFTMEIENNRRLPFIGMEIIRFDHHLETCVYRKKTDKGLLLHYQSHVDNRYKRSLIKTMLNRADRLSSTAEHFNTERSKLRTMFLKLKYPEKTIDSTFNKFKRSTERQQLCETPNKNPVRIVLPFKDQKSTDRVRRQLTDLSRKINHEVQPVFTNRKLIHELKVPEVKPSIVNQQCVVYEYRCDSCDANYVGYTRRHLHQRTDEHRYTVIGKHEQSHSSCRNDIHGQFTVLKRCQGKFDCLIYEMLFIRKIKPTLNTQGDSVKAKLFISTH